MLATATELLDRVGAEGLTTNLIASESGVNISSIYKYFPNKHAILVALFERYNQQRFEAVRELVRAGLLPTDRPLRVLDVGAGLGAMTFGLLRALPAGAPEPSNSWSY